MSKLYKIVGVDGCDAWFDQAYKIIGAQCTLGSEEKCESVGNFNRDGSYTGAVTLTKAVSTLPGQRSTHKVTKDYFYFRSVRLEEVVSAPEVGGLYEIVEVGRGDAFYSDGYAMIGCAVRVESVNIERESGFHGVNVVSVPESNRGGTYDMSGVTCFFSVKLRKITEKINIGGRYVIEDIGPSDAFYHQRREFIGSEVTVTELNGTKDQTGEFVRAYLKPINGRYVACQGYQPSCFAAVKLTPVTL